MSFQLRRSNCNHSTAAFGDSSPGVITVCSCHLSRRWVYLSVHKPVYFGSRQRWEDLPPTVHWSPQLESYLTPTNYETTWVCNINQQGVYGPWNHILKTFSANRTHHKQLEVQARWRAWPPRSLRRTCSSLYPAVAPGPLAGGPRLIRWGLYLFPGAPRFATSTRVAEAPLEAGDISPLFVCPSLPSANMAGSRTASLGLQTRKTRLSWRKARPSFLVSPNGQGRTT